MVAAEKSNFNESPPPVSALSEDVSSCSFMQFTDTILACTYGFVDLDFIRLPICALAILKWFFFAKIFIFLLLFLLALFRELLTTSFLYLQH
jgi:hypothetical protein